MMSSLEAQTSFDDIGEERRVVLERSRKWNIWEPSFCYFFLRTNDGELPVRVMFSVSDRRVNASLTCDYTFHSRCPLLSLQCPFRVMARHHLSVSRVGDIRTFAADS